MKRKPWPLVIIALLHVLAPFGNLVLNALKSDRTLSQQWFYWFDILPKQLVFIYVVIPVLAGIFIFICKRWSYWAYLACLAIVFVSNVYSFTTDVSISALLVLILVLIVDLIVVAYFVVPSVQKVYFDPRLRWWEAAPRYHFDQDGQVNGHPAFLKNLGQGGLFMNSSVVFSEGDHVDLFWTFEGQDVRIPGVVVYKSPVGYGVKFEPNQESSALIAKVIVTLHQRRKIVVERLPGPEDGFLLWFKRLITTGQGLFPKFRR